MENMERILVCIKHIARGAKMLQYLGSIARLGKIQELHLLYVKDDQVAGTPPDNLIEDELKELAAEHYTGNGSETIIPAVVTGATLIEILRYMHEKSIDLAVLGKPSIGEEESDEAPMARRVTRKATCSVLVLPEDAMHKAEEILVPVRDTECSVRALDTAFRIARTTKARVDMLNIYHVTSGYSNVGTTREEHIQLLKSASEKENESLLRRTDPGTVKIQSIIKGDEADNPVGTILKTAKECQTDLIVIGARGRTGAAGVLLGKVTEQLIQKSPLPLLAVKKKGECLGIVQALLSLTDLD